MSARTRGEHGTDWDSRWRPAAGRGNATAALGTAEEVVSDERLPATDRWSAGEPANRRRLVSWVGAVVAVIAVGVVAGWSAGALSPTSTPAAGLPSSPRAWLDSYEAAAVDDPGRVCSQLFSPALASAYAGAVRGTCGGYFAQITSFSVTVRRVLRDGGTAVLELRQTVSPRDWAVVLDHRPGGWQAVDLLAGDLPR